MRHEAFKIKELEINDFVMFLYSVAQEIRPNIVYRYHGSEYYEDDENYTGEWYIHKFEDMNTRRIRDIWSKTDLFYQSKNENVFLKVDNLEFAKLLYETKQAKI